MRSSLKLISAIVLCSALSPLAWAEDESERIVETPAPSRSAEAMSSPATLASPEAPGPSVAPANDSGKETATTGAPETPVAGATRLYLLQTDLDGDGKPETLEVTTVPGDSAEMTKAMVTLGNSTYVIPYYSAEGWVPLIQTVAVDTSRPQRQVMVSVKTVDGGCEYHLFASVQNLLAPLLKFSNPQECRPPMIHGGGSVTTHTWKRFWVKEETYMMSFEGDRLRPMFKYLYDVSVAGAAGPELVLKDGDCPAQQVEPGKYVQVTEYDSDKRRYRVETLDGGCGWVAESAIHSGKDSAVRGLVWRD